MCESMLPLTKGKKLVASIQNPRNRKKLLAEEHESKFGDMAACTTTFADRVYVFECGGGVLLQGEDAKASVMVLGPRAGAYTLLDSPRYSEQTIKEASDALGEI